MIYQKFDLDRYTEIERENKILLDKMTSILNSRSSARQTNTMNSIIQDKE